LQTLLGDLPSARFLAEHYHRLPYSAAGKAAALCELGTWEALTAILSQPDADTLVCRRNEQRAGAPPQTIDEAQQLVQEGYTLLVRHAERHDERLAQLAEDFAADLGGAVNIHMYCTPGGQFGFGWHYDAEEVFIVQTTGRKEYLLRKNTVNPWPIEETLPADMHYEREIMPLMRCELAAGDWLYIPSGYWHMGQSHETAISLAIGVQPRTAVELFDFLRPRVLDSLLWRQRLPVVGEANPNGEEEFRAAVKELIPQLVKDLSRQLAAAEFVDTFVAQQRFDKSLSLYNEGRSLFEKESYDAAAALLLQSCREIEHYKTRELLGECFDRRELWSEALPHYESAYRLNPRSNKTAILLASLLRRLGRHNEAAEIARQVIARAPTYGPARELLNGIENNMPPP
jgi:ribosomal protein L16 Arg81 hydroxylase